MGLQALKPTLREKKRYICFSSNLTDISSVKKGILSRVKAWIGEKNYALGRVHLLEKLFFANKGIISCNHKEYPLVKEGIILYEGAEVFYVSGSLKKAQEKLKECKLLKET